jgi:hypothetical protein
MVEVPGGESRLASRRQVMSDETKSAAGTKMAAIFELEPNRGSIRGGNQVTIVGEGLRFTDKVLFGDRPVKPENVGPDGLRVRVIAPSHEQGPGPVEVRVLSREGMRSNPLTYMYTKP